MQTLTGCGVCFGVDVARGTIACMIHPSSIADARLRQGLEWLAAQGLVVIRAVPASEDASFRRYFRITLNTPLSDGEVTDAGNTVILMDAPPAKEDSRAFVRVAEMLSAAGMHVPRLHFTDLDNGYLLLDDLGSTSLLDVLEQEPDMVDYFYDQAGEQLHVLQNIEDAAARQCPPYDEVLLRREMQLFPDWLCKQHLNLEWSHADRECWKQLTDILVRNALSQPRTVVHRDFHSRNLMVRDGEYISVIDFQDAVYGHYTYDIVSLLRDCYVEWPLDRVRHWAIDWLDRSRFGLDVSQQQRLRWFFLSGVQRQLKAAGIFARLAHRDGKWNYLPDVPRTLNYICEVSERYPELDWLCRMIEHRVLPGLAG